MSHSRNEVVGVLRRAGLGSVADDVEKSLPEDVDEAELRRFLEPYAITPEYIMELMGGNG